ncbi:MAG: FtsX-like permease family protein, partial [Terriglobales bacterium]
AGVLALFGMLAVLLSALGLYALLAGGVARRRLEFGTRMALGARPAELARGIVRSALALAAIGAAAGTLAAACLARYLGSVLVGIQTSDWRAYAIAPAVLLAVALLSSLIPARRAARSSPADLFRCG